AITPGPPAAGPAGRAAPRAAARGRVQLPRARPDGHRPPRPLARDRVRDLLRHRPDQPLHPATAVLADRAQPAGLGLPGQPGRPRRHRARLRAAAAGQAVVGRAAAVGLAPGALGAARHRAAVDPGAGRLGRLRAGQRPVERRAVVSVAVLLPAYALLRRLGGDRVDRPARRGQGTGHRDRLGLPAVAGAAHVPVRGRGRGRHRHRGHRGTDAAAAELAGPAGAAPPGGGPAGTAGQSDRGGGEDRPGRAGLPAHGGRTPALRAEPRGTAGIAPARRRASYRLRGGVERDRAVARGAAARPAGAGRRTGRQPGPGQLAGARRALPGVGRGRRALRRRADPARAGAQRRRTDARPRQPGSAHRAEPARRAADEVGRPGGGAV
ncbi:MAG: Putative transmembrane protein, partial [uncultured Corynebacteriales bacterium]